MSDGRSCTQCKEEKPRTEFSWKGTDHKRLTSRCHSCRRANYKENPERNRQRAIEYHRSNRDAILARMKERNPEFFLLRDAKKRARDCGVPFNLTLADITIPAHCPVLGFKMQAHEGKCGFDSPTLDRVVPARGYVRGNVVVISHRANTIKSDATLNELLATVRYVRTHEATSEKPSSTTESPK